MTALLSLLSPNFACFTPTTQAQGKYDEAEPLLLRGLAIREKELGPDHPNVATSCNDLSNLKKVRGSTK